MNERDQSLDFLRAIGLMLIILAHVKPPQLLFQLRTFDVIVMVAVSTISFTEFSKPKSYGQYLWGRVKRLLVPTWLFIILQSLIFYVLSWTTGITTPFSLKTTIIGLLTLSGIGYLWVIRVFLYNALLNPFIKKLATIFQGGVIQHIITLCLPYCIMETALSHYFSNTIFFAIAEITVLNFAAYVIIAMIAYKLYMASIRSLLTSALFISMVLTITCILQRGFIPNAYKYPPQLQYILWGLFVTCISFLIFRYIKLKKLPSILTFISINSLWIYFWHVIILNLVKAFPDIMLQTDIVHWLVKWLVVAALACLMAKVQNFAYGYFKKITI